jgi:ElaB/YqjD/DUF883 family membrane-anchored ribosome-binding protein
MESFSGAATPPGDSQSRTPTESKALLSQCKELARTRLSRIIADALDKVEADLFTLADGTPSRTEQQVLLEAMAQLKQHRSVLAAAFDQCFIDIFDRRLTARKDSLGATAELSLDELALVENNTMEENLIIGELARKTMNGIDPDQLMGIRARFGHLLSSESLDDDINPISPEAIFEALRLACAKIPGEFAVKRSLLSAFQPYVAAGIGAVYADVNQNLITHHVLPRIRHHVQRTASPLSNSQSMGLSQMLASQSMSTSQMMNLSQPMMMPSTMAMSGPIDFSALLAGVLSGPPAARQQVARMLSEPSRYSLDSAMATPATPALVNSLSQLQAGIAAGAYDGHVDYLAALDQQVRNQSHPLDQLTIELVTMVFDYILEDKDVPDTVKAEISRLQIVAVKAALLDRTFFARRQHPMRQLLDRIAAAAQDPEIDTRAGSTFVTELHAIGTEIIQNFENELDVFNAALEQLTQAVAHATQAQRSQIDSRTDKLVREEEREAAHSAALIEIRQRMARKTPGFVREFLYQWWSKTLADARLNTREGDDSWDARLLIVESVIWSVAPLKTAEIQKLATMLPGLMRSILRGMNAVDMPAEARHAFFTQLMQTHTSAINTAKALTHSGELAVSALKHAEQKVEQSLDADKELETAADAAPTDTVDIGDLFLHSAK